ncbi:MAG: histidinol-phosphate transaminase [Chitinophagaceae bacterium]|nr:MAG: histidinol-phosphate transaminase [Chitinophagaceae bacterium]
MDIKNLQRENIKNLTPYSTARHEFKGTASIYLDANENSNGSPLDSPYNRYPDPQQNELKAAISLFKGVPSDHIFIGNGSDEAIDLLIRAFCEPGVDNVIIMPPTYGMYEVSAAINNVAVKKVTLNPDFQLDMEGIAEAIDKNTKLIFLCSPNNPTGNALNRKDIETILTNFNGLVIVDEAYINFSKQHSFIRELTEYVNLVVLQTFSKAWGLAALRVGMAFSSAPVIEILNKVKPPYNINLPAQQLVIEAIKNIGTVNAWIKDTVQERIKLGNELSQLSFVEYVYPSDANFLLVKVQDANAVYASLCERGIITRNRNNVTLCEGCVRITVGTSEENRILLENLKKMENN